MYAKNAKTDIVARDVTNQFQLLVFKLVFVLLKLDFIKKTSNSNLVSMCASSVPMEVAAQDVMNQSRFSAIPLEFARPVLDFILKITNLSNVLECARNV